MTSRPLFVHCCHCRWCQRETGSAFVLNAMIEADRVRLLAVDVDADGDVDLVAGRVVHFARGPLTRSPLGGFDAPPWFGAEGDLAGPRDGDGDGDLDLGISPYGGHRNVGLPRLVNTPFTAPVGMEFVRGMNVGDFDADGDVDSDDLGVMQRCFAGNVNPPDPNCAN